MIDEHLEQAAARAFLAFLEEGNDVRWEELRAGEKQRWRNVASAAGAVGQTVVRLICDPYLTAESFDWARTMLGGVPVELCTVIAGTGSAATLRQIAALGAKVLEVPPGALASRDAWIMVCPDGRAFSVPE